MPDEHGNPTVEELQQQLTEKDEQIKEKDEKIDGLGKEKDGILGDLKTERQLRQEKEQLLKDKEGIKEEIDLKIGDDEYVTGADLKKERDFNTKQRKTDQINDLKSRAIERMDTDEERMREKKELPISYDEAMEKFKVMAEKDPSLWEEVNREACRTSGRPAQKAYKIVIREDPEFIKRLKEEGKEELLKDINKTGKIPVPLKSGGGGDKTGFKDMTAEEIGRLSEADLDKALAETG